MDTTIRILLDVIKGLLNIIDEQALLIQRMLNDVRRRAEDDS